MAHALLTILIEESWMLERIRMHIRFEYLKIFEDAEKTLRIKNCVDGALASRLPQTAKG